MSCISGSICVINLELCTSVVVVFVVKIVKFGVDDFRGFLNDRYFNFLTVIVLVLDSIFRIWGIPVLCTVDVLSFIIIRPRIVLSHDVAVSVRPVS